MIFFVPFGLLAATDKIGWWDPNWKIQFGQDIWVGLACLCLLIFCTQRIISKPPERLPLVLRVLQAPALVRLGAFSYSLYLVHALVLVLVYSAIQPMHLAPNLEFLMLTGIVIPLSLLASYAFHLVFEKPFMSAAAKPKYASPPRVSAVIYERSEK